MSTDSRNRRRGQDALISATANREMFDRISGFYDNTNHILSLGLDRMWRKSAVAALAPVPGGRYLDVGSGTGDIALEVLRQCPGSAVLGIDPSEGMLELGRTKVRSAGLDSAISLIVADVLDLQYGDNTFDGAITAFCVRNVTDRRRGLSEIRRVVRPGGRLIILELTEPTGPIMRPLFRTYARLVMPLVTKVMSSVSAYRYLADSMADFPRPQIFLTILQETGYADIRYRHLTGGIVTLFSGAVPEDH